ncbi:MAG: hypothetical protein FD174_2618 [Geobacteraceae bacterium]|nr:MAG: hypothetical protein FD174_2618 [Geobacteraceae bacterium]
MASVRKYWRCTNSGCKNPETGKHRGYKKVHQGEKKCLCKHCEQPMALSENYVTRIVRGGQQFTKSVSPRKDDATAHLAACVVARKSGALFPGEEPLITWLDAAKTFEKWMDSAIKTKELSEATAKHYRNGLKPLGPYFKDMVLQDMEKRHVEDFKTDRREDVGASTVNMSLATLKRLFTINTDNVRAKDYPRLHEAMTDVFKVKLLELKNEGEIILETDEEVQALLDECKTPHLHHFAFGILNTGLRHQFMWSLKWPEINFDANEIVKMVKGGTVVRIPLTDQYRDYLKSWQKSQKVRSINGYVIPSRLDPATCYRQDSHVGFPQACERAAVKFEKVGKKHLAAKFRELTPHHLRHTFATHYLYKASKTLGATAAVHVLSKILGHSGVYITERYSHVLKEINQASMVEFGNQMFPGTVNGADSP